MELLSSSLQTVRSSSSRRPLSRAGLLPLGGIMVEAASMARVQDCTLCEELGIDQSRRRGSDKTTSRKAGTLTRRGMRRMCTPRGAQAEQTDWGILSGSTRLDVVTLGPGSLTCMDGTASRWPGPARGMWVECLPICKAGSLPGRERGLARIGTMACSKEEQHRRSLERQPRNRGLELVLQDSGRPWIGVSTQGVSGRLN
jgi:hypothetical protein